jgi:heme exporter protein D
MLWVSGTRFVSRPSAWQVGARLTDFFAMGGYAAYVWPAYGIAALVLIALLVASWRGARRRVAEVERLGHLTRPARARRATLHPPRTETAAIADLPRPTIE